MGDYGGLEERPETPLTRALEAAYFEKRRELMERRRNFYEPDDVRSWQAILLGGYGDGQLVHLLDRDAQFFDVAIPPRRISYFKSGPLDPVVPTAVDTEVHRYVRRHLVIFDSIGGGEFDDEMEDLPQGSRIIFMVWDGQPRRM